MNLLHAEEIHDGLTITSRWSRIRNSTLFEWVFGPIFMVVGIACILSVVIVFGMWCFFGPLWIITFFPEYFEAGTWHSITLIEFLIWAWLATWYALGK